MTSPGLIRRSLSAGPPGATVATSALARDLRPKSDSCRRGTGPIVGDRCGRGRSCPASTAAAIAHRVDGHREVDADVSLARLFVKIIVLMPMTSPRRLSSGPPELPVDGRVGLNHLSFGRPVSCCMARPVALTTPMVTVHPWLNGLPIAITQSPAAIQ